MPACYVNITALNGATVCNGMPLDIKWIYQNRNSSTVLKRFPSSKYDFPRNAISHSSEFGDVLFINQNAFAHVCCHFVIYVMYAHLAVTTDRLDRRDSIKPPSCVVYINVKRDDVSRPQYPANLYSLSPSRQ